MVVNFGTSVSYLIPIIYKQYIKLIYMLITIQFIVYDKFSSKVLIYFKVALYTEH